MGETPDPHAVPPEPRIHLNVEVGSNVMRQIKALSRVLRCRQADLVATAMHALHSTLSEETQREVAAAAFVGEPLQMVVVADEIAICFAG